MSSRDQHLNPTILIVGGSLTHDCMMLIDQLLTLDPAKRPSATSALFHEYFWCDPLPADPERCVEHSVTERRVQLPISGCQGLNPRTSWTADGKRHLHRSNKVDHHLLCTSNISAGLVGIHQDLMLRPCSRLAHTARHNKEEGTTPTGGTMAPAMVHPIIICRPSGTRAGIAGNRVDRLSRVQVIPNPPCSYLLDCLNAPILLDTPTDVDQVLMVLHSLLRLMLTTAHPQRGRRRVDHLRMFLEG